MAFSVAARNLSSPLSRSEPTLFRESAPLLPTSERGSVLPMPTLRNAVPLPSVVDQAVQPAPAAGLAGQAAQVAGVRGLEVAAGQPLVGDRRDEAELPGLEPLLQRLERAGQLEAAAQGQRVVAEQQVRAGLGEHRVVVRRDQAQPVQPAVEEDVDQGAGLGRRERRRGGDELGGGQRGGGGGGAGDEGPPGDAATVLLGLLQVLQPAVAVRLGGVLGGDDVGLRAQQRLGRVVRQPPHVGAFGVQGERCTQSSPSGASPEVVLGGREDRPRDGGDGPVERGVDLGGRRTPRRRRGSAPSPWRSASGAPAAGRARPRTPRRSTAASPPASPARCT